MIVVVSQPNDQNWSNNDVIYKLKATDEDGKVYGKEGVAGYITFPTIGIPPRFEVGDSVVINWQIGANSYAETFRAVENPVGRNELQAGTEENYGSYFKRLLRVFQSHPRLSTFFYIKDRVVGGFLNLKFLAKEVEETWNISIDVFSDKNISAVAINEVVENPFPPNYQVKIDVCFQSIYNAGHFDSVLSTETKPESDGTITINLKKVLHKESLSSLPDPPIPPFKSTEIIEASNRRKYYLRYTESYGEPVVEQPWVDEAVKEVMIGGIDQELFASTDLLSAMNEEYSLLTWHPDRKEIVPGQPDFLSWYNYSLAAKDIVVEVRRFKDEEELSKRFVFDDFPFVSIAGKGTAIIPINTDSYPLGDEVTHFCLRVVDASSEYEGSNAVYLSPPRFYVIDYQYHKDVKYLVYLNSFFLPESVKMTGVQTKDLEVGRQLSAQVLEDGYKSSDKEITQYEFDWENVWTYRSGYLSREEVDALQQMLIYNYVYEVLPDSYRALLIQDKKFKIAESLQLLHSLEFSVVRALKAGNYINLFLPLVLCCYDNSIEFAGNCILLFGDAALTF